MTCPHRISHEYLHCKIHGLGLQYCGPTLQPKSFFNMLEVLKELPLGSNILGFVEPEDSCPMTIKPNSIRLAAEPKIRQRGVLNDDSHLSRLDLGLGLLDLVRVVQLVMTIICTQNLAIHSGRCKETWLVIALDVASTNGECNIGTCVLKIIHRRIMPYLAYYKIK